MSENESWYYARDNQQYGPVGVDVVRRMLSSGELRETDLVWMAGMPDWKEARAVEGLIPPVRTEAPQQQPPPVQPAPPPFPPPPSWGGTHAPQGQGPVGPMGYAQPEFGASQHGKAVAALVCSIFSILCAPFGVGLIAGVVAIVLASNATSNMARLNNFEGRGLAKAGFIVGIIGVCLSMLVCGVRVRL